jgi:hypothetical protein
MIQLPKIHPFSNTEDVNVSVMFTLEDKSRLVIFALDDKEEHLIRFFYAGDYASYVIGTRAQIAETIEEDLHGVGQVTLNDPATALPALKNWGLTALAKRFKKK